MTERCNPQHLVLGDTGFASRYRYYSTKRLEEMLAPDFFLPVRSQTKAGDFIHILQMESMDVHGQGNRVLRMCEAVVVHVSQRAVYLDPGPIREMPLDFDEAEAEAAAAPQRPKLEAKWNGPTDMWTVLDPDGQVLAKNIKDKKVVEQMVAGVIPLPGPASASPTPPATTESSAPVPAAF